MNYDAEKIDAETLRFERHLPGPIERVWAFLTESDKRRTWLAAGPMELRVGGKVELTFFNSELSSHHEPPPEKYKDAEGAKCPGRVVQCEAPKLLSFTWNEGGKESSEVRFELSPQGEQVLLVVTHRKLPTRNQMVSVAGGWHVHLGILEAVLKGIEPGPFWSTHAKLEANYEKAL